MILALRVLFAALRQVGGHLGTSFVSNFAAVLLSLPLLVVLSVASRVFSLSVFPLGVVLLLGVLPNPALAGLQAAARSLSASETPSLAEQRDAVKRYWRPSLIAWFLGTATAAIIIVNLRFYAQLGSHSALHILAGPLEVTWAAILLVWLALHFYVYPLLLRQERPAIGLAYRNAAVIVAGRPLVTLVLVPVWLGWLLLTATTGPAYLIGLILAAAIQQNALSRLLPSFGLMQERAG